MKNPLKRIAITVAAAAALSAAIPMSSAAAANRTDCTQADFVQIWNYNHSGHLCFANPGSLDVRIYGVDEVDAGNNVVDVTFDDGSRQTVQKQGSIVQVDGEKTITNINLHS